MTEQEPKTTDETIQTNLQEEYLKSLDQLEEGQLIKGNVIQVGPEYVFVDVGYKSEGKVPVGEFKETPEIGDHVDVVLLRKEGREGEIVVSKSKADEKALWQNLRDSFEQKEPVEGVFEHSIKGGFEVDLGYNIKAFNPISKTDISRVEEPDKWVGVKSKFLIDRLYSDNKLKIVLSRRDWLEREIEEKRRAFFENTSIGDEVKGTVKSFTSFGAFIDLGGFDGLLHINDMSWGHVTRPKDYVSKGQEITLQVIKLDPEEMKINLSLKHFTPDPWSVFEDKYQVGDVVQGSVTKLTDFGAFIELEEGIEGLAHISELSWVKRINHPKELLKVGDEVEAKILSYDLLKGRVSLGIKQVQDNPWDTLDERYPVGTVAHKEVKKITNAGAFVELEEGIDAFIHVDDFSWTKKIKNPQSVLQEGEFYDFKVISLDKENFRIRVGLKQLSDDPWDTLSSKYRRGDSIEGTITSVTDFGIFVRVEGDIEGLVHKSNLVPKTPGEELDEEEILSQYKEGDSVTASVVELNPHRKKLALSMKDYQKKLQREELSKYIHDEEEESTATFGDILKNKETNQPDT
jgi:small subunit ribosomal protein S1